jgi:hypothetical protein
VSGFPGNNGYTTENYDLSSTMNYTIPGCPGYVGNYNQNGLGELEKISLHFMYPENQRVAEFIGKTVITTGEMTVLRGLWEARGAAFTVHQMILNYVWLDEASGVLSTAPYVALSYLTPGRHTLMLLHMDYLGRAYAFRFSVTALSPSKFGQTIAGPIAASMSLLMQ